jgi:flagellar hook protein FlgE
MALTSTLFTGLSGLDVNQTWLNVIGNNIANVNSVAFKSSSVVIKPQFYVTDNSASAPTTDSGGTNPSQRGLGASVDEIQKNFTPGAIESTGVDTNMALDGSGFFIVKTAGTEQFTRDGSFTLNSNNQLVTTSGGFVQGFGADTNGNVIPGQLQQLTIPLGTSTIAEATKTASMQGNLDASGDVAAGATVLNSQDITTVGGGATPDDTTLLTNVASTSNPSSALFNAGDVLTLTGTKGGRTQPTDTFTVTNISTLGDLTNFYQENLGIDTTAPVSAGMPTPGASVVTDPSAVNSAKLVISGNVGDDNALTLGNGSFLNQNGASPFTFGAGTDANGVASDPSGSSVHTTLVAYNSLGTPVNLDVTAVLQSKADTGNTWQFFVTSPNSSTGQAVGNGTLTFDPNGKLESVTGDAITMNLNGSGAATPLNMTLDFSKMTQLTDTSSSMVMTQQDGSPIGTLASFSVGTDGTITGAYSNGMTKTLGQVAVANFSNPEGLDDKGGNMYAASASSGVPVVTNPTSLGTGALRSESLELSNVDISTEFTNMISASTGFSAASRVITTSNQLIQDLLNSTR